MVWSNTNLPRRVGPQGSERLANAAATLSEIDKRGMPTLLLKLFRSFIHLDHTKDYTVDESRARIRPDAWD